MVILTFPFIEARSTLFDNSLCGNRPTSAPYTVTVAFNPVFNQKFVQENFFNYLKYEKKAEKYKLVIQAI